MMEDSSMQQLTQISANHLAYVTQDNLSAREAVAFLLKRDRHSFCASVSAGSPESSAKNCCSVIPSPEQSLLSVGKKGCVPFSRRVFSVE